MSAITGIFMRNGKEVDPQLMKKMNDKLFHRGPDGSAIWCDGPVGLGHQMLWTTPESLHEILPLEENGLVITADARIDNRAELSEELGIPDEEDVSDSYFILKAYAKWGDDCPDKLLGDFAFAIWDKNKEKLFCARDHMGVKPFYYYLDDDMFVFGTEIKSNIVIPEVKSDLNEQMIAFYLMGIDDYKSTFYKNIFSLTPAHWLKLEYNSNELKEYWKLDPKTNIIMESEEEYAKKFREIFLDAVRCRLRSAFPLGFELSGGIDSSSIVCSAEMITKENKKSHLTKINTFSFVFEEFNKCDERYYIEKVTNSDIIEPHFTIGDHISPLEEMKSILWYNDQPLLLPNLTILWNLYKKIQSKNMRIILCGTGGDAVVSHGNKYLRDLAVNFKWKKLIKEFNCYADHYNLHFYNFGFYYYFLRHIYPPIIELIKHLLNPNFIRLPGIDLLNKDFSKEINAKMSWNLSEKSIKEVKTAKEYHYHGLDHNKAMINALITRDSLSSAFSIEGRYPFLDKRIVEYCYAIPTEMKFKFGWSRYILRIAMAGILPEENQWRKTKANLSPISKKNMLLLEKDMLDEMTSTENEKIRHYIDIDLLKNIYKKFISGKEVSDSPYALFLVSQLFLWLKEH